VTKKHRIKYAKTHGRKCLGNIERLVQRNSGNQERKTSFVYYRYTIFPGCADAWGVALPGELRPPTLDAQRGHEPTPIPSPEGNTAGRARKTVPLRGGVRGGSVHGKGSCRAARRARHRGDSVANGVYTLHMVGTWSDRSVTGCGRIVPANVGNGIKFINSQNFTGSDTTKSVNLAV
jgi:hypothetical protein